MSSKTSSHKRTACGWTLSLLPALVAALTFTGPGRAAAAALQDTFCPVPCLCIWEMTYFIGHPDCVDSARRFAFNENGCCNYSIGDPEDPQVLCEKDQCWFDIFLWSTSRSDDCLYIVYRDGEIIDVLQGTLQGILSFGLDCEQEREYEITSIDIFGDEETLFYEYRRCYDCDVAGE